MSWTDEAACAHIQAVEPGMRTAWDNVNTYEWTYGPDPMEAVAKAVCATKCPVREECLRAAIADEESDGIHAGYRFHSGKVNSRDAYAIKREWNLKVRVLRRTAKPDEQSTEVPEVPESD